MTNFSSPDPPQTIAEGLFESLIGEIPLGVILLEELSCIFCNRSVFALAGHSQDEPMPQLQELIAPEEWDDFHCIIVDWQTQGPLKQEFDSALQTKRGGRVQVHVQLNILKHEGKRYLAVILRNITRFKLAEQQKEEYYHQLTINLEYFDNLFEKMPLGAWILDFLPLEQVDSKDESFCDIQHRALGFGLSLQRVNQSLVDMLGFSKVEMKGISIFDRRLVDEENAQIFMEEMIARRQGKRGSYEITLQTKTGQKLPVMLESIPTLFNPQTGEANQSIGLMVDLRERKKWEAELHDLNQQLRSLSQTDALTSLANRRHLDDFLLTEWKRAQKENLPLSVIMMDIDDFKPYNDNYGHLEGDQALQKVACQIKAVCRRKKDLVARFGGEEFMVVLPNTPSDQALRLAEELGHKVRQLRITHEFARAADVLTLSLGVACLQPGEDIQPGDLLTKADVALYQSKEGGRDRATLSD